MNAHILFALAGGGRSQYELAYIWNQATPEAKLIILLLLVFSIVAWSVMISKAVQMRRAKRLNGFFLAEFKHQNNVLALYDRRIHAEGCPLFNVYQAGGVELDARLRTRGDEATRDRE